MDWTQEKFVKMAKVSLSTVRDFKLGRSVPIANNLDAMRRVIEEHGVRLIFDGEKAAGITVTPTAPSELATVVGNRKQIGEMPGTRALPLLRDIPSQAAASV